MKLLVISDSHMYNDKLLRVIDHWRDQVDLIIHCGDSSLPINDPLLKNIDIIVKGNHDIDPYPPYVVEQQICVTHGHLYHVYQGYEELIQLCQQNHCHICFHGHTHVPTHQIHQGIHFINPGCLMMNRGSYGYGTYAIVDIDHEVQVQYFHHDTDELCSQAILDEGYELLEEFKNLIKEKQG